MKNLITFIVVKIIENILHQNNIKFTFCSKCVWYFSYKNAVHYHAIICYTFTNITLLEQREQQTVIECYWLAPYMR